MTFSFLQKFSAEKYEFSTALPLPNTIRWIPAGPPTKVNHFIQRKLKLSSSCLCQTILSPLENATHLFERTNRDLKLLVEDNEKNRELNVTPLSGKTAGILDAAVMGGASVVEQVCVSLQ